MAEQKPPGIFMPPGLAPKPGSVPPRPMILPTPGIPTPAPTAPPGGLPPLSPPTFTPSPAMPPSFAPPSFSPPGAPPAFAPPSFSPPGAPPSFAPPAFSPPAAIPGGAPPVAAPPSQIRVNPSAVAPVTQTQTAQTLPTGRVVVFSGPKEGVGKTTIALNLALAWAGTQSRNVILVHLDPLCRNELSFMLNLQPPTLASLTQTVGKDVNVLSKLLKGRVPISQWGVGALPLGNNRLDAASLNPAQVVPILESLCQSYDLFIDVDPFFPMQVFAFDLADVIFWTCLPQRAHFEATYNMFQDLKTLHFPLERFEVVINEGNLPGALAPKEVERFFAAMNKRVLSYMPWEDLLPEFANTARVLVVEQPHSDWVKALRPLLGIVMETKPHAKDWAAAASGSNIEGGIGLGWGAGSGGSGNGTMQVVETRNAEGKVVVKRTDVPEFWDELKGKVHKNVVTAMETERIRIGEGAKEDEETRKKVGIIIDNLLAKETNLPLSRDMRSRFVEELIDEILGLGPLETLMRDPSINEIMVNAPDRVYIEQKGRLVLTPLRFRDDDQVIQVIKRIVAPVGRRIDESVPLVDARLKDGSRVNAIIPPLAVSGATLTIRRFSKKPFTGDILVKMGSIEQSMLDFLAAAVHIKKSFIISGGTGTGKTTFLNMLSNYIPEEERIITVEDTAELRLQQQHWIRLESRPPNVEGKGEVTIRDLVKNCLRMRPDRIVVGECRGSEAFDMLQAMNTGHEGSMATIHANTPRDALTRLEAMCMMASSELPIWAVREMVSSAVHMIIQLTRFPDGVRRITYVTELTGRDGNTVLSQDIFRYCQTGVDSEGKSQGFFTGCGVPPKFYPEFKLEGLEGKVPLTLFHKRPGSDEYLRGSGK
ncbi:MAG: Flp pilus assembly complex ATPase component TadA [Elusimicrobia bacterium]|nr:Flp pilus assembly complex ATPase component TadA [Elusimicrobiota bacterium]